MVLAGMALGFLATVYGACRYAWRFGRAVSGLADGFWFLSAALVFIAGLVVADWGQLRLWALVLAGVGFGLWTLLAEPVWFYIVGFLAAVAARGAHVLCVEPSAFVARHVTALLRQGWQSIHTRWRKPRT